MRKMAILLVGLLFVSAFLVAGQTGKIEKFVVGIKSADCKGIVYMNPASISAIGARTYIETDQGRLFLDQKTKALYDEGGNLVATRLANSEYIPAGFDLDMDGILRGEEAAQYSRWKFSQFSGSSDVHPEKAVWDEYIKANGWEPSGIDNPYTSQDESIVSLSQIELARIYFFAGITVMLLIGAVALWLWWRR